MKKIRGLFAIGLISVLLFSGTLVVSACEYGGNTPGFWKNHLDAWGPTGYSPNMLVGDFFNIPSYLSDLNDDSNPDTLLDALKFKGRKGVEGATRNLLRAAVAGLLNSAHPDVNYIYTYADLQWLVNYPLSTGDKDLIEDKKDLLDTQNNLGSILG